MPAASPFLYGVIDAYRADVSARGLDDALQASVGGRWVAIGTLLQRAVALPSPLRVAYLGSALGEFEGQSHADHAGGGLPARVVAVSATASEEAERHSAYCTATVILELAGLLVETTDHRSRGRLLAQRGRVLRKIGQLDAALEIYKSVALLAAECSDDELAARAALGRAAVARERGNYPEARAEFRSVLATVAANTEIQALHGLAHQGLQIAAAMAGDFDAALRHGRAAFFAAPEG